MEIYGEYKNKVLHKKINPRAKTVYIKNLRATSEEKRLKIAFQLYEFAISLCKANILENNPHISDMELKRILFERLGNDRATIDKLLKK